MNPHLSSKYNVSLKSNCNDAQGPYRGLVTTRQACMGAQSHISPDLSHEHRAVLQYFSSNPDVIVNDNGDVKMRDEGSSRLSSVVGDKSRLDELSKTISSFLFLLIMNVVDLNCTVLGVTQQESGRCLSR